MSFLGIRTVLATSSKLSCNRPPVSKSVISPGHFSRRFNSTEPTRRPIGRIIPKRIAVRVPRRTGTDQDGIPSASIWRPIIFCLGLGGFGYYWAAAETTEETLYWTRRVREGRWWSPKSSGPTDRELMRAQILEEAKEAQKTANALPQMLNFLPTMISTPIIRLYVLAKETELNTPPAMLAPQNLIIGFSAVFLLWKIGRIEPFMRKWFLHRPVVLGGPRQKWQECVTLFTSTISHSSLPHLLFNSIAFYSFGSAAYAFLASPPPDLPKQASSTTTPHFLAFLLSAALFSSLGSHLFTNIVKLPRLVKALSNPARLSTPSALAAQYNIAPSLGASGAIYATMTLTACAYPDTSISIIFLPFITAPIGLGVFGVVCMDLFGLIRGWRTFDHVAHLSGGLFGLIYYKYGREFWHAARSQVEAAEDDFDKGLSAFGSSRR